MRAHHLVRRIADIGDAREPRGGGPRPKAPSDRAHTANLRRVPTDGTTTPQPLSDEELAALDAWWRAANYLSVGQIYLMDNPLLREPLRPEHIKPRLLGHWGTTPGLNFLYAHLNRAIRARD